MKNKTMGNVLKAFLIVGIILFVLALLTEFISVISYDMYIEKVLIIDQIIGIFTLLVWVLLIIFYLIWLYQVHADFRRLTPDYEIKPGGALLRVMVPFYNLYGTWNVYSTMGNFLSRYSVLHDIGKKVALLTPIYYFLYWGTSVLDRLILKDVITNEIVVLTSYALDVCLIVSFYLLVKNVLHAFKTIEENYEALHEEMNDPPLTINE